MLKFLYYVNETKNDILSLPDLTPSQIRDVVDTSIYRYQKVEGNNNLDKKCYLSMNYGIKQYHTVQNPYFNGNTFDIYIMCERDVDYIEANGSRIDAIEHCLASIFDNGDIECIGRSRIDLSEPINIRGSDYTGVHITIAFYDKGLELNG